MNYRFMFDDENEYLGLIYIFQSLNNFTNLAILKLLNVENILTVSQIAEMLGKNQGSISRNISQLERAGLVKKQRAKNKVFIVFNVETKQKLFKITKIYSGNFDIIYKQKNKSEIINT